jgi:hypothetical protein
MAAWFSWMTGSSSPPTISKDDCETAAIGSLDENQFR